MYTVVVLVHILICIMLVVVILLQSGKGGGIAGAFGGSSTSVDSYFGGRGAATFLTKLTVVLAALFMIMCVVHTFIIKPSRGPSSVLEEMAKSRGGATGGGELPEPTPLNETGKQAPAGGQTGSQQEQDQ
jgi:preprotein translocase subunit SecG